MLCFADDQIILPNKYEDLECMTYKLTEEYRKWSLEVNLYKTEYMCIGGKKLYYNSYKYLVTNIPHYGTSNKVIPDNVQERKAIALINSTLWDRYVHKGSK